jgi:hypothetical protein
LCEFGLLDQSVICGDILPVGNGHWIAELWKENIKLANIDQIVESIEVILTANVAGRMLIGRR